MSGQTDSRHAEPAAISTIRVKNLRLRTFIGFNEDERTKRQDVVINLGLDYDARRAARSDQPADALDYKHITKSIIALVEDNRFLLLERLAQDILDLILADPAVIEACVEVDKPHALRFADSVSVTVQARREQTG